MIQSIRSSSWKIYNHEFYFCTHSRKYNFIICAENGWCLKRGNDNEFPEGAHGYDNEFKDMHAIFYATGSAFKENYSADTFENVNIYPLIAYILGIDPAEVDGALENVSSLLNY